MGDPVANLRAELDAPLVFGVIRRLSPMLSIQLSTIVIPTKLALLLKVTGTNPVSSSGIVILQHLNQTLDGLDIG